MKHLAATLIALALALAGPAPAEVLDQKAAAKALFRAKGYALQFAPDLSDQDRDLVRGIIPLMARQLRQPVRYYAAIAWSPDDGLVHESLQAAMNYHNIASADRAAVAACDAARSRGARGCQVAARVLPKGYETRPLTLSVDATVAFDKVYRREKAPKSFARSPETGGWGMGKSDEAALQTCENSAKTRDCEIVIRN